jgi:hypothetical protein
MTVLISGGNSGKQVNEGRCFMRHVASGMSVQYQHEFVGDRGGWSGSSLERRCRALLFDWNRLRRRGTY